MIKWFNPKISPNICIYGNSDKHNIDKFIKIQDILHSPNYDIYYNIQFNNYTNITHLLENDFKRVLVSDSLLPLNPKYLLLQLSSANNITFTNNNEIDKSFWSFNNKYIKHVVSHQYLSVINKLLVLSNVKQKWNIYDGYLKNIKHKLYISCDINYTIYLTENIDDAIKIHIENNMIYYIKSPFRVKFEINNAILKTFNIAKLNKILTKIKTKNCVIILAGGNSTRFNANICKQLYILNDKPVIIHTLDAVIDILDYCIIITNTKYYKNISELLNKNKKYKNVIILINDYDCRLESISLGLKYINTQMKNIQNVIIHDCARCFIKEFHIKTILDMNYKYKYSQYYLKLINGLYKKNSQTYEDVNRDDYIELMTPLCINFYLAYYIFITYMEKQHRITYEFITILNLLKIPCNMIEGHISFLKKITTIEDIL